MLKIGILLGDDIGLEVVPESVKVLKAAAAKTGLQIEWQELPIGKNGHALHGNTLPPVTATALETCDGWIMGPIGHNAYPRNDPTWVMPPAPHPARRGTPRAIPKARPGSPGRSAPPRPDRPGTHPPASP